MISWPESDPENPLEVLVATGVADRDLTLWGWFDSHSSETPDPGPHIALNGLPQKTGQRASLVVHLDQVPALVAALAHLAAELKVQWHENGAEWVAAHEAARSQEGRPTMDPASRDSAS